MKLKFLAFLIPLILLLSLFSKLNNPQVELTQPDQSMHWDSHLNAMPIFGQTFVPRQAGLNGIYLPIAINLTATSKIILHVKTSPTADHDMRVSQLTTSELAGQNLARFTFEPLPDSFNTPYYFWLEALSTDSVGVISLKYAPAASYVDGALYIDGKPYDGQATFYLAFDRYWLLRDWGWWSLMSLPYLLALLVMTFLIGLALLVWASELLPPELDWLDWLALAAGLSLASYPLLLLWLYSFGLPMNTLTISLVFLLSGLMLWYKRQQLPPVTFADPIPIFLFLFIIILSGVVRIVVVRGQDIPMFGDSYHHTVISQLIVDNQSLFNSWQPYAPIETLTYHFGFHSQVATYHWLTAVPLPQATLVMGQWINLLTVLMAYFLGKQWGGSYWTGMFAALITGLLSIYPMFYTNWGRYTQLSGQVILPVTMYLTWIVLKSPTYKISLLTALNLAGLILIHYRIMFFYVGFAIPLISVVWLQTQPNIRLFLKKCLWFIAIQLGALTLTITWLWVLFSSRLVTSQVQAATNSNKSSFMKDLIETNYSLFDYVSPILILLTFLGIIWGCWQQREGLFIMAGWLISLLIIAVPHLFGLPGSNLVTAFAVLIALYLPFSIFAGTILGDLTLYFINQPEKTWYRYGSHVVVIGLVMGLSFYGARERLTTIDPQFGLVTKPDLVAMAWIREHTLLESKFWVNSMSAFGNSVIVGTDAGWWLPYLTGRQNTVPPISYATEVTNPLNLNVQLREFYQETQQVNLTPYNLWQTLKRHSVTHVYIGQRQGKVGNNTETPISPIQLEESGLYQTIYQHDHVWIFALK